MVWYLKVSYWVGVPYSNRKKLGCQLEWYYTCFSLCPLAVIAAVLRKFSQIFGAVLFPCCYLVSIADRK